MSSHNESGRFGEIANQSAIVVNGQHDTNDITARANVDHTQAYVFPGAPATQDNATARIDINDIVFTVAEGRNARRGLMNNAIPVASNCNGLFIYTKKASSEVHIDFKSISTRAEFEAYEEELLQILSETVRPIGQALGASVPLPEMEGDLKLNFTIRTHGTAHILNTGSESLVPGETVCWDFFRAKEISSVSDDGKVSANVNEDWKKRFARYGFSLRKVPLKLVKLSSAHTSFEQAIHSQISVRKGESKYGAAPTDPSAWSKYVRDINKDRLKTAQGRFAHGIMDFIEDIKFITETATDASRISDMVRNRYNGAHSTAKKFEDKPADAKLKQKAINDLIKAIMYLVCDLDRRRIGTALSYAKAGKGVDMLLQL